MSGESWGKKQRTRGESGGSGPQDTPLAARGRESHRDEGDLFPVHERAETLPLHLYLTRDLNATWNKQRALILRGSCREAYM